MIVNLYIKEDLDIEEDSIAITIIRKSKDRFQSINVKKLDNLTAIEQQTMRSVIAMMEKYRGEQGSVNLKYGL
jgi:hypothetical protein